jgi:hypothetical protein
MPVDFPEPGSKPGTALFSAGDCRGFLSPVTLVFPGRCQAPAGVRAEKRQVADTVDNVLTDLAQRIDPAASGTPPCSHRILLAEVIEILCLLNDGRHQR